ncbi:hypothetical protein [Planococcus lenghuensis]|uniref:Uncharacterized protein n=1 Tax=Planococcus lenghuensis TaxID=2213202 RepID=A0A1Q2KWL9_9BACL|nr:hypothetical protein [Planococcus lenghuensis]AQQ52608.1 hypothetical protein B0X71_05520 [Planococcus lenghuensis]
MKNAAMLLAVLLLVIATGFKIAYASSPTQENSEIQVAAVNAGLDENGDTVFKIYFMFDLDKNPILANRNAVQVDWPDGWRLESYNLMEDGKYRDNGTTVRSVNKRSDIRIAVDSARHFNQYGQGQGYIILTSEDKEVICEQINSSVHVGFHYTSPVKKFKFADSAAWNNEAAVGFH